MASKLFVGNLPFGTNDIALKDFVTKAGFHVASAVVTRDQVTGKPQEFGFVELAEGEDIQRAITGLNGKPFVGRRPIMKNAYPQRRRASRPGVSGFDRHLLRRAWAC